MEQKANKRKWSLNLFDLIVIVLAVLIGAFLLYRSMSHGPDTDTSASGTVTVRYTVQLTRVLESVSGDIQMGDVFVDGVKKYTMGTVQSVTVGPYVQITSDYDNETYRVAQIPDYNNLMVELETKCDESSTQLLADGGFLVRAGEIVAIKGPGYAATGTIVSIDREGM